MRRGSVFRLGLLALCWGSSFLWIKLALRGFTPVQIVAGRIVLGAAVLLVLVRISGHRLPRRPALWGYLLGAAVVSNVAPFLLFAIGEQRVGSGLAGVLNGTTPLWTFAIALAVRHEREVSAARVLGLVLGFGGVLLIFSPWRGGTTASTVGALACLVAGAAYGVSYVYMDRYLAGRELAPIVLSSSQLAAGSVLMLLVTPVAGRSEPTLRADSVIAVVLLGVICTGVTFALNYRLIADEGATATSTVAYLLPVVAVILGALALGEPLTAHVVAGMAVVLVGVGLARRRAVSVSSPVGDPG
ncbi:MAG TPA: DMT family transporter [Mycobacteriales bacterium]|nr:DMT family transporter [Mycobacteriales bacterium]